jgi:putative ABC transport system permease protein
MTWWKRRSDQLEDEIQTHIDLEMQENIDAGMSPAKARHAAMRKFGNILVAKDQSRDVWGWVWLERLWQDVHYALRGFRKNPSFTAVALLSLTLGIGASIALFSVVYGVLIAPYPYAKPNEIWAPAVVGPNDPVRMWHRYPLREMVEMQKLPAFTNVMATIPKSVVLSGGTNPEGFYGVYLTGNAFNFIGVKPLIGRTIQPFDIHPGGEPDTVVVLTYQFWLRYFSGDANALGKKITLNDVPYTIIGVMPPRFGWWTNEAFWLPLPMNLADDTAVNVITRLRPGITKQVAEQQLHQLNLRLAAGHPEEFPKGKLRTVLLNYMDITQASGEMSSSLHLLFAAVGLLLLIACVNVANLQLARTTTRAREIAMRLAIGAGRGRLVRQLLTESVMLSVLGGVLGVLFAIAATRIIVILIPPDYVPNEARITVNGYVLLFSLAVSMLTGILFGLAPALRSSRPDLVNTLKDGGSGATGGSRAQAMRNWLVVAEISLSVMLLAGASLAIRNFTRLLNTDPGFQPERVLQLRITLPPKQYNTFEQRNLFDQNLLESITNIPGVEAAALGNGGMPYSGWESSYSLDSRKPLSDDQKLVVSLVSEKYPQTMGIPLNRGREFTETEIKSVSHVALINESAAKLWPAKVDPVGRHLQLDALEKPLKPPVLMPSGDNSDLMIVGVIGDTKNGGMADATRPAVYLPYTMIAPPDRQIVVRTAGSPLDMANAVREKVRELDKGVPVGRPVTLDEVLGEETQQPRFNMSLFSGFAALGLTLAGIGIYSVISYTVTQRIHEIGVRMALGAKRRDILKLVLLMVAKVAGLGMTLGLCGSVVLEHIVRFEVFAKTSFDLVSLAAVVLTLSAVSLLAAWMPASRAGDLDPVTALRHEA